MRPAPLTHQAVRQASSANALPASAVESDISSGLVAVEGVSGLISDLFFENKAHKDAVAVFRDTLEREREISSRLLQETNMTLDAWRSQFVTVQEENTRLRHLGTMALRHLHDTERRAQEAEALLREVSATIGPNTLAVINHLRRVKRVLQHTGTSLRAVLVGRPLHFIVDTYRRAVSRLLGGEARQQVRAAAE